jgi:hypothetical protein
MQMVSIIEGVDEATHWIGCAALPSEAPGHFFSLMRLSNEDFKV